MILAEKKNFTVRIKTFFFSLFISGREKVKIPNARQLFLFFRKSLFISRIPRKIAKSIVQKSEKSVFFTFFGFIYFQPGKSENPGEKPVQLFFSKAIIYFRRARPDRKKRF